MLSIQEYRRSILDKALKKITIHDYIELNDISGFDFFNNTEKAFFITIKPESGERVFFGLSLNNINKVFYECTQTESGFAADPVNKELRKFYKLGDSNYLCEIPNWISNLTNPSSNVKIPYPCIFELTPSRNVEKFTSMDVDIVSADHCQQTDPSPTYILTPFNLATYVEDVTISYNNDEIGIPFIHDLNIRPLVADYIRNKLLLPIELRNISTWDVSNVQNMNELFQDASFFNEDLLWDVSSVTDMSNMFQNASSFNGDISRWDVSHVQDMMGMFFYASSFNGDISRWDVSHVDNMMGMFFKASSFNGDISRWDVSHVTEMSYMFAYASSFNADISRWNVSRVRRITKMFYGATSFKGKLSDWNLRSYTYASQGRAHANSRSYTPANLRGGKTKLLKSSIRKTKFYNKTKIKQNYKTKKYSK